MSDVTGAVIAGVVCGAAEFVMAGAPGAAVGAAIGFLGSLAGSFFAGLAD